MRTFQPEILMRILQELRNY